MGLFGSIKRAFGGGGGVGAKLELPKSFTWEDAQLAITVTLIGHKEESRTVEMISFRMQDVSEQDDNNSGSSVGSSSSTSSGSRVDYTWDFIEAIQLGPKEERALEILMPLPFANEEKKPLVDTEGMPGFLGKVLGAVTMGPPTDIRYYTVQAKVHMTDVKGTANASKQIRYGGAFRSETSIGGFKIG